MILPLFLQSTQYSFDRIPVRYISHNLFSYCMRVWLNSETQRELEERTHEVLDMDNALKERQGELQQRAQLVQHTHKPTYFMCLSSFFESVLLTPLSLFCLFFKFLCVLSSASWMWPSKNTSRRWRGRWSLCNRAWRPERGS